MVTKKIFSALTAASGSLIVVLLLLFSSSVAFGQASHVRWDIISITPPPPPLTPSTIFNPGGVASATADPYGLEIKFTGSGTFVAPPNGGISGAVTGGGTWETFSAGVSTGSGTYLVTKLVSWEFANFQTGVSPIDNIGDVDKRANGTAVLKIDYSDGSQGTLVVGCHGPGAPAGIFEGVTATKGFVTYWNPAVPPPNVDENRTLFHLQ
jgi:hypothetical protein